jgi:hypothetical protein
MARFRYIRIKQKEWVIRRVDTYRKRGERELARTGGKDQKIALFDFNSNPALICLV